MDIASSLTISSCCSMHRKTSFIQIAWLGICMLETGLEWGSPLKSTPRTSTTLKGKWTERAWRVTPSNSWRRWRSSKAWGIQASFCSWASLSTDSTHLILLLSNLFISIILLGMRTEAPSLSCFMREKYNLMRRGPWNSSSRSLLHSVTCTKREFLITIWRVQMFW